MTVGANGVDTLDQLADVPRDDERIFVYRIRPGTWTQVFVRPGGRYESGVYDHVELAEDLLERLRDMAAWARVGSRTRYAARARLSRS